MGVSPVPARFPLLAAASLATLAATGALDAQPTVGMTRGGPSVTLVAPAEAPRELDSVPVFRWRIAAPGGLRGMTWSLRLAQVAPGQQPEQALRAAEAARPAGGGGSGPISTLSVVDAPVPARVGTAPADMEAQVPATAAARLSRGVPYAWQVTARGADGVTIRSAVRTFSLSAGSAGARGGAVTLGQNLQQRTPFLRPSVSFRLGFDGNDDGVLDDQAVAPGTPDARFRWIAVNAGADYTGADWHLCVSAVGSTVAVPHLMADAWWDNYGVKHSPSPPPPQPWAQPDKLFEMMNAPGVQCIIQFGPAQWPAQLPRYTQVFSLAPLSTGTMYAAQVTVVRADGEREWSNIITFTRPQ